MRWVSEGEEGRWDFYRWGDVEMSGNLGFGV